MPKYRKHEKCKLWWCNSVPYAGGLCGKHYMRYYRNQSALRKEGEVGRMLSEIEVAHRLILRVIEQAYDDTTGMCVLCGKAVIDGRHRENSACQEVLDWVRRTSVDQGVMALYDLPEESTSLMKGDDKNVS